MLPEHHACISADRTPPNRYRTALAPHPSTLRSYAVSVHDRQLLVRTVQRSDGS